MNYLIAHISGKKSGMRLVLSNEVFYTQPDTLVSCSAYAPDDSLQEGEWFYLEKFSQRDYFPEFLKGKFNGSAHATITQEEINSVCFLAAIQDDGFVYFQRVTKTQLLKKKRLYFGQEVRLEREAREIVIKEIPDAIYNATSDRLYFVKLSSITAIFEGISEIFREATEEETRAFLGESFVVAGEGFDASCVKQANRKNIALAKEALSSYDEEQRNAVLQSIREYYPSIINDENSFKIECDNDLTYLLYGILQRYYTTADGREKRIARTVRSL